VDGAGFESVSFICVSAVILVVQAGFTAALVFSQLVLATDWFSEVKQ